MNASGSYVVVEFMIREKKVLLFELEHLLESLEQRGLISSGERRALLQLGNRLLPKHLADPS